MTPDLGQAVKSWRDILHYFYDDDDDGDDDADDDNDNLES